MLVAGSEMGLRPGHRNLLGLADGYSGSINAHSSSSMIGFSIPSAYRHNDRG